MSIRQGVFRVGETVEISATFADEQTSSADSISGAKLYIKKPPLPDGMQPDGIEINIVLVDGVFSMDLVPEVIGTWKVRFECALPSPSAREVRFEVVDSMVTPILPYSFY